MFPANSIKRLINFKVLASIKYFEYLSRVHCVVQGNCLSHTSRWYQVYPLTVCEAIHDLFQLLFSNFLCVITDGEHCVDIAEKELSVTGLRILSWATYHRGEHYTDGLIHCSGFDKKYTAGDHVYYRLVLWMEDNRYCEDISSFPKSETRKF